MFSLAPHRMEALVEEGHRGARTLRAHKDDPHRLLVTILVGNNLVNIGLSSIATGLLELYLTGLRAVAATTFGVTALVLLFGGDQSITVRGDVTIEEINEALDTDLPENDGFETIAGLVFDRTGRISEEGETVESDGVRITVEEVENTRIMKARVARLPDGGPVPDEPLEVEE